MTTTYSQQGSKLVGSGATAPSAQGSGVSIYDNTLAWGGPQNNTNIGAVWIYTRSATTWTLQSGPLIGTGASGAARQGCCVSLYKDTLAVGGYSDATNVGATWIFIRSNNTWVQQGLKLVGTGNTGASQQGTYVSLYENTLAVGAPTNNSSQGAVWIFVRTGTTWSQTQLITLGAGTTAFGICVSLYEYTLAIGANADGGGVGATYIYVYQNATWSQQQKLIGSGASGNSDQGSSISLFQDTVAIGGQNDNSNAGATWLFTREGTTWTQIGSKIVATGATGSSGQGSSVALYENTLVIGAKSDNTSVGAIYVFGYNGTTWNQVQKLVGTGNTGASQQGKFVTVRQNYIATSGTEDSTTAGAVWPFYNGINTFTDYNNVLSNTVNNIIPETHGSRHSATGADVLTLTNGNIYLGNVSNQIADITVSGDATMANTGAFSLSTSIPLSYLVVGGGGGGGAGDSGGSKFGGGGGGGGVLSGSQTISGVTSASISVTIGTGGAAGSNSSGSNGTSSSISGTGITTITALGGGGGGGYNGSIYFDGASGGCGGGGNGTKLGGSGTVGQGFAGGAGASVGPLFTGGGGGGAGTVGTAGVNGSSITQGGNGATSNITGFNTYYGGGGGGASLLYGGLGTTGGAGLGGGGIALAQLGTPPAGMSVNGTNGLGGGGGGSYTNSSGGTGGSGLVIISVPVYNFVSYSGSFSVFRTSTSYVIVCSTGGTLLLTSGSTTATNKYSYSINSKGLVKNIYGNLSMYFSFSTITGRAITANTFSAITSSFLELSASTAGITVSNATATLTEPNLYLLHTQLPFNVANSTAFITVLYKNEYLLFNCIVSSAIAGNANSISNTGLYLLSSNNLLTSYYESSASGNTNGPSLYGAYFTGAKIYSDTYSINYGSVATSIPSGANTAITATTLLNSNSTDGISVSNGVITISVIGFYIIHYQIGSQSTTGVKETYVKWTKAAGGTERIVFFSIGANANFTSSISASGIHYLSPGDTLTLYMLTSTTGSQPLNITDINTGATINTYFNVCRIVPSIYVYYYGNVATTLVNGANGTSITETTMGNKFATSGITTANGLVTIDTPGTYMIYHQVITDAGTAYFSTWIEVNGNVNSLRWNNYTTGVNAGITESTVLIKGSYAGSQVIYVPTTTTLRIIVYQADGTTRTLNPATNIGGETINTYFVVVKID